MLDVFVYLLKGLLLGALISLPIGGTATLCLKRTLDRGGMAGFMTGLGAAVADAIYAAIGAFGLTIISDFLVSIQFWIRLVGGVFLIYLGIKSHLTKSQPMTAEIKNLSKKGDFFSTFFLTLTNPMTMFAFVALFAGIGVQELDDNYLLATIMVLGVFVGALLCWGGFSACLSFYRKRMTPKVFHAINKVAAILLSLFGIIAIISAFFSI